MNNLVQILYFHQHKLKQIRHPNYLEIRIKNQFLRELNF